MIVAIQQPEHLPWIGFFHKMTQCDIFVYLDTVQFKKRYYENRNRIKTKDGIRWLTIPVYVKGKYKQKIKDVQIFDEISWKKKYISLIEHSYKKAPYWNDIVKYILPCLFDSPKLLSELNITMIESIKKYLNIDTICIKASDLDLNNLQGSQLIMETCLKLNADQYISGPSGKNYLDVFIFEEKKIRIKYHNFLHPEYPQMYGKFASHLSIIDLLVNCGTNSRKIIEM